MNGVFGSAVLDVAIGLSYVYLLLALFCTTINEWIAGIFNTRGRMLAQALKQLLDAQAHPEGKDAKSPLGFGELFAAHPLVAGLGSEARKRLPSYLSPAAFSAAILDVVAAGKGAVATIEDVRTRVAALPEGDVRTALSALLRDASDVGDARKRIEDWFNEFMDRVTGWYKRQVQIITVVLALLLCATVNADSIRIFRNLWQDSTLRNVIVEQAKAQAERGTPSVTVEYEKGNPVRPKVTALAPVGEQSTQALHQLLGWSDRPKGAEWLRWLLGIALSTAAVSLGAPFWFDFLKRFVSLRSSGKSPDERTAQTAKAAG